MSVKAMFEFKRGAFFSGQLDYRIANNHFSMRAYNAFHSMRCFSFNVTEEDLQAIYMAVSPIMEWKEKYDDNDFILDGFGWSIRYCHNGTEVKSQGYETYPPNYKKVIGEIQECMEILCKKYAADQYREDEAEQRRQL